MHLTNLMKQNANESNIKVRKVKQEEETKIMIFVLKGYLMNTFIAHIIRNRDGLK